MREFRRNKETGILEIWENGKNAGEVRTMGDEIIASRPPDKKDRKGGNRGHKR